MYTDKDNRGRFAIMDLTEDELETLRRALLAYKTTMAGDDGSGELRQQCIISGKLLNMLSDPNKP